jgi:hypothetical protein
MSEALLLGSSETSAQTLSWDGDCSDIILNTHERFTYNLQMYTYPKVKRNVR